MWKNDSSGRKEFKFGKEAWEMASYAAEKCIEFFADDEDEHVSDIFRSCYNCRYRRWIRDTFVCLKT
jgi:hypothetical protein